MTAIVQPSASSVQPSARSVQPSASSVQPSARSVRPFELRNPGNLCWLNATYQSVLSISRVVELADQIYEIMHNSPNGDTIEQRANEFRQWIDRSFANSCYKTLQDMNGAYQYEELSGARDPTGHIVINKRSVQLGTLMDLSSIAKQNLETRSSVKFSDFAREVPIMAYLFSSHVGENRADASKLLYYALSLQSIITIDASLPIGKYQFDLPRYKTIGDSSGHLIYGIICHLQCEAIQFNIESKYINAVSQLITERGYKYDSRLDLVPTYNDESIAYIPIQVSHTNLQSLPFNYKLLCNATYEDSGDIRVTSRRRFGNIILVDIRDELNTMVGDASNQFVRSSMQRMIPTKIWLPQNPTSLAVDIYSYHLVAQCVQTPGHWFSVAQRGDSLYCLNDGHVSSIDSKTPIHSHSVVLIYERDRTTDLNQDAIDNVRSILTKPHLYGIWDDFAAAMPYTQHTTRCPSEQITRKQITGPEYIPAQDVSFCDGVFDAIEQFVRNMILFMCNISQIGKLRIRQLRAS